MDPATANSLLTVGAQHGFNAALVVVLLVGCWRLLASHASERAAAMAAYLGSIDKLGARVEANTAALNTLGESTRATVRTLDELRTSQSRATG